MLFTWKKFIMIRDLIKKILFIYIYIYIYIYINNVTLLVRVSLTLSRHPSVSSTAPDRSSRLYLVSV